MNNNKNILRRAIFVIIGTLVMALGAVLFNIPSNFAAGGVTGFSQVLNHLMPNIQIGIIMAVSGIALFILGIYFLGREFGVLTVLGFTSYTLFIGFLTPIFNIQEPILEDVIINLILGASLMGFGLSIVFRQNASTGGTDVVAKIIQKYTDFSLSQSIMIIDALIILFASAVFGIQSGIYSFLSLFVTTYVLDVSIQGLNSKIQMTIISKQIEEINEYISKTIVRGTTFYKARGGYTRQEKEILVTIVSKKQYFKIRNYIRDIGEDAFVYINNINEVYGYGFSREMIHDQTREDAEVKN